MAQHLHIWMFIVKLMQLTEEEVLLCIMLHHRWLHDMYLYCNSLIIIVLHCGFILYHNVIQYTNCWFYFIIVNDSNDNLIIGLYVHNNIIMQMTKLKLMNPSP